MVKHAIRTLARKFGVEITRYHVATSEEKRLLAMLSAHEVNLVLDVGANVGQFGAVLRSVGYRGRIVSFEPLSDARERLVRLSARDPSWEVAPRCAIGAERGEVDLHIAGNSVSSSVLPMSTLHSDAAPDSAYVGVEKTQVYPLDELVPQYLRPDSIVFLKIDTQGYEDRVLRGAERVLDQIVGLQLEMSFVELYEGQLTFDDLRARLVAKDFELWSIAPAFVDIASGRVLQVDATFFRRSVR